MKLLLTIREQDVEPQAPNIDSSGYRERAAARAVLINGTGEVYLMYVSKYGYHKLPGGGIDDGESTFQALERELLEEVGCNAEVLAELGMIIEHRDFEQLRQVSYCYLAKQTGEQQESALEAGEIEEGLREIKANSIDAAIELLAGDKPENIEGLFIQKRDLQFLQAAKTAVV